jgi:hypothetical protein
MKPLLIFISIVFIVSDLAASSKNPLYPDVTILSSDQSGMTIEFRPQFQEDQRIESGGDTLEIPQFLYSAGPLSSVSGDENISTRILQFALPGEEGNSISIIASDYETVGNFHLAPVPESDMIDNYGTTVLTYTKKNFPTSLFPNDIVQLTGVGKVKGWIVGSVRITPLQYLSTSRSLRKYSRIVVRITYGAKATSFEKSMHDEWAQASLLNYSTGKSWEAAKTFKKASSVNSVLASGTWYKLEVTQDGMYKIDPSYLKKLGIDATSLSSMYDVKIFGADGKAIAEDVKIARPSDLPQIAVEYVDNNNNSKFDSDDYILFYGQGVTGWTYDRSARTYSHYTNPYTNSNYYFLSVGSSALTKKAAQISITGSAVNSVTQAIGKVFFDEEKINLIQSGQNWVSAPFTPGDSRVISNKVNGYVSGTSITYKFSVYSRSDVGTTFSIDETGQRIAAPSMPPTSLTSVEYYYASPGGGQVTVVPTITDQRSNLKFTYNANSSVGTGYIDTIELFYTQSLTPVNDQLIFYSPDTSGEVKFSLSAFSSNANVVFDVTDVNSMRKISIHEDQLMGSFYFYDSLSSRNPKKYWAGSTAQFLSPVSFTKIPTSNLHGLQGTDFLIITHNDFRTEAERLKTYKESKKAPISTTVVDVDTIYNEFGIGMPDPVAMRDFIKYAVDNWSVSPKYVLFFGDASYDYKNILNVDKSWVPTFETSESNYQINSYCYDDFFGCVTSDPTQVSLAIGRLCPRSGSDANFLVDRIILYESSLDKSLWRNLITNVADDIWTPDNQNETEHQLNAESLAAFHIPKSFEVRKIYEGEYATVFTSAGRRKPEVRQGLIDQVNSGTLLLNFTGHGNPKVWAHESILTLDDVKNQFTNSNKLTFIVGATCDWGRIDEAGAQSSAEEVTVNRNGGAIGVMSATRAVYSGPNYVYNRDFYDRLFAQTPPLPLGDVTMLTKFDSKSNLINTRKYFLLGDPTMRLAVPRYQAAIDSINGAALTVNDTLRLLEKITVSATVRDDNNAVMTNFNGTAVITVFDAQKTKTFTEIPGNTFTQNGSILYKGESTVKNGFLTASFIMPKDIAYENKNGRISIYFSDDTSDGKGYTTNFIVGGTSNVATTDSAGPAISIYFDNTSFHSGDVVNNNPLLIVDLKDSSGINSSGSSIGHRIEAWIDGGSQSIDLTNYYKGTLDNYKEGTAQYTLSNLSIGNHSIKVRGWDVYNNSSATEAYFTVASSEELSIQQLYNFPNPVSTSTTFTFLQNQLTPIDVQIKIYTVAGRLIHTINRYALGDRFVKIDWNRRDSDGDEVGNGIYFYKVFAKTIDGKYSSTAIGKMAIVR